MRILKTQESKTLQVLGAFALAVPFRGTDFYFLFWSLAVIVLWEAFGHDNWLRFQNAFRLDARKLIHR